MGEKNLRYSADFEIEHGVSRGLDSKTNDRMTLRESFNVLTDEDAFRKAYSHAEKLAKEYLSTTKGYTRVTICLKSPEGNLVDQKGLMQKLYTSKGGENPQELETFFAEHLPEGKAIVKTYWIEHILDLVR